MYCDGQFYVSTGLTDAQIVGKTLFFSVSVREFLEKISIGINSLSKDPPHQCGWGHLIRERPE